MKVHFLRIEIREEVPVSLLINEQNPSHAVELRIREQSFITAADAGISYMLDVVLGIIGFYLLEICRLPRFWDVPLLLEVVAPHMPVLIHCFRHLRRRVASAG